jgi:hypothetical protein
MKPVKFKSVLVCDPPEKGWHYVAVEAKIAERFEKKDGSRRVVCTLNGSESFQCALMPYNGTFYIMVNKAKRTKLGITAGDKISVELAADESKYGMPMPEEFQEVLRQDPKADKLFHALTSGMQRSLIYIIGSAKGVDRRIHLSLILLEHLKDNGGKIDRKSLQEEIKRPLF